MWFSADFWPCVYRSATGEALPNKNDTHVGKHAFGGDGQLPQCFFFFNQKWLKMYFYQKGMSLW